MSKILTVFGATGNQGGSVVAAVHRSPELSKMYKVRAVTRDPTKPSAQKLKDMGAEVVKGDMNDPASLREAVRGADTVFLVTNFWEGADGEAETRQGKAMADAAVAEGVDFIIASTLPNVKNATNGKLNVPHFDHKAYIEDYIRTLPIKSAFYWPAFFMQNFSQQILPTKNDDGSYTLYQVWDPNSKLAMIDVSSDTGKFVAPLLLDRAAWAGRRIYGAAGFFTPEEIVATLAKGTGKTVDYKQVSDQAMTETMSKFLPPAIASELIENMVLMREYLYYGPEGKGAEAEVADSLKALLEKPVSFEEFVANNKVFQ